MAKPRKVWIRVKGHYYPRINQTPEGVMKDMLRYDSGSPVGKIEISPMNATTSSKWNFSAIVQAEQYTHDRWQSFGMYTAEIYVYDLDELSRVAGYTITDDEYITVVKGEKND